MEYLFDLFISSKTSHVMFGICMSCASFSCHTINYLHIRHEIYYSAKYEINFKTSYCLKGKENNRNNWICVSVTQQRVLSAKYENTWYENTRLSAKCQLKLQHCIVWKYLAQRLGNRDGFSNVKFLVCSNFGV